MVDRNIRKYLKTQIVVIDKLNSIVLYSQSNLREALFSHSAEYRRTYLAALAAVTARADPTSPLFYLAHLPPSAPLEEPVEPECLDLLLGDLEEQRGGPEFLSQALYAASLLLVWCPHSRFVAFIPLPHHSRSYSSNFPLVPICKPV